MCWRSSAPAIIVDQQRIGGNARSTVGTYTDAYTMLRVLFAASESRAPARATATRFNDPRGCARRARGSAGSRRSTRRNWSTTASRSTRARSTSPTSPSAPGTGRCSSTRASSTPTSKVARLHAGAACSSCCTRPRRKVKLDLGSKQMNTTYEGLIPKLQRLYLSKELDSLQKHIRTAVERISTQKTCDACDGARLNAAALATHGQREEHRRVLRDGDARAGDLHPHRRRAPTCSRWSTRWRAGSSTSTGSGSATSAWTARPRRCPAASRSG